MKRLAMTVVLVAATAALVFAAGGQMATYKADLASSSEVPAVSGKATGVATFEVKSMGAGMEGGGTGGVPNVNPTEEYPGATRESGGAGAGGPAAGEVLHYSLALNNIDNVTAAHLHMGKTAAEGPVVAPLYLGPKKSGEFSGTIAEGTLTDKDLKGPLAGKTVQDLVNAINAGEIYVNVHTTQHPAGEIRGQVKG